MYKELCEGILIATQIPLLVLLSDIYKELCEDILIAAQVSIPVLLLRVTFQSTFAFIMLSHFL